MLRDLCSICHIDPRRYTCPRCGLQTCSVACVKKHKSRSQCSGTRDPGAYVRRYELAAPSILDQDFNFITGLERSLEKADRIIGNRSHDVSDHKRSGQGELNLRARIQQSGAIVRKAPPGISRSKQNKTYYQKRENGLMWTIEWVLSDGSRIFKNHAESTPVAKAWASLPCSRSQVLGKRKAEDTNTLLQGPATEIHKVQTPKEESAHPIPPPSSTPLTSSKPDFVFYLHQPLSRPNVKKLITLVPDAAIANIVRGRVLLEFPTIFVLPNAPSDLPKGFVLEYGLGSTALDDSTVDDTQPVEAFLHDGPKSSDVADLKSTEEARVSDLDERVLDLDERKILEVLQKDLGAVT